MVAFFLLICLSALVLAGCGGGEKSTSVQGFADSKPAAGALIVDLENMSYLRKSDQQDIDGPGAGLIVWSDLDGDQCDDIVLAGTRQGRGGAPDPGWVEARSGTTGKLIWQATGVPTQKIAPGKLKAGYRLGQIAKISDVDRDGVADIYCQEQNTSPVFLFSGKTGKLIEKRDTDRVGCYVVPIRDQDIDGKGVPDLWFVSPSKKALVVHAALGGKHLRDFSLTWPGIDERQRVTVAVANFTDSNGDGSPEILVRRYLPNPKGGLVEFIEMAVLSGKDLKLLHKFATPCPRVTAKSAFAAPGDLTGDGYADVVMASYTGEGPKKSTSFIRLIDGHDGTIVWMTTGDLPGGVKEFAVDVKTGKRTDLPSDIKLGGPVVVTPDVNGDKVKDLATVCATKGGSSGALFVFSGRDGKLLGTIAPPADQVRLSGSNTTQLGLLIHTKDGAPRVVATARNRAGKTVLVTLALPVP